MKYNFCSCGNKKVSISKTCKKCLRKRYIGKGNPNWKGNRVKYAGVHAWIKNHLKKPKLC